MLFNSAAFLWLFLPVVLLVHTPLIRFSVRLANLFLLIASLLFYIWGSGALVVLLGVSVLIDHFAASTAFRGRQRNNQKMVRSTVFVSALANVGLLGWFKYAGFLGRTIDTIAEAFGMGSIAVPSVVLPIGISFFTFQSMSYTFDVANGKIQPFRDPLRLLLYVSLFPQLIAGPIVRASDIAEELRHRQVGIDRIGNGFSRFSWGLAKKVLIADSVAPLVDASFGADPSTLGAWIAALSYAVQIYFDFSGYSDMAIGLGMMLGFTFPENFRRPYAAMTVTDFWRRWHITLSSWFRDYLYIPAGGNRGGPRKTMRNLLLVFFVTGLWHGAAWTFVVWGLWHGSALLIERSFGITAETQKPLLRLWTAVIVLGGWVLFRSPDMGVATSMLRAMVLPTGGLRAEVLDAMTPLTVTALIGGLALAAMPERIRPIDLLTDPRVAGGAVRFTLYFFALPLVALRVVAATFSPFLYFQF